MAHSLSARKRIRQNEAARARNRWRVRNVKEAIKDLQNKILHGSAAEADESFKKVCSQIDRAAVRGVIHKNAAARTKSRLSVRVKAKKQAA
ncbi:MAG: 30S ribosomal protein S20 [Phycisphaerales bacterium]|nr:30S ribosomal protein S20 [Phycisphaerales bacterium]